MDKMENRLADNKSESTSSNIILYSFLGIIGLSLVGIVGFLIYSIF
jgi:hypothetical protein